MNELINNLFSSISNCMIFGLIPLGKTLHVFLPMLITIVMTKMGIKFKQILVFIFLLCVLKELYDLTAINSDIYDSVKDLILDMIYPLFVISVQKSRRLSEALSIKQKIPTQYSLYLKSENVYLAKDKIL